MRRGVVWPRLPGHAEPNELSTRLCVHAWARRSESEEEAIDIRIYSRNTNTRQVAEILR